MADIKDIKEAWEGHTGSEVESYIKREFGSKYGFLRLEYDESSTFYNIEAFASEEDADAYDDDPEGNEALRLLNAAIPISTVQGDAYTARLATSIPNTANIVVVDNNLVVPLNFRAIKITQIGNENAGGTGTLVIQRSTDGGASWSDAGTIPNALTSQDVDNDEMYQDVNIGQFLANGAQLIRLRATYAYENEDGETKNVTSSAIMVGASVTKTSLRLDLVTNYEQPMSAKDANGNPNPFSVVYAVYGSVQKTAYLKVTGSAGTSTSTYVLAADVDSQNKTFSFSENASIGYTTHGVKKVEAWLECGDGLGNTIKSEVLVNRFMVVNEDTPNADLTKPYLLLQNVDGTIDNFVQTEIAQYAVYNPSGEDVNVTFLLTGYSENYESNKPEEYFRLDTVVKPNTQNRLLTTIEIENEDEGTEIKEYTTYFRVRRVTDTTDTDFMNESTGEKYYRVIVDNTNAMTPVSGATFLLNPKVRNNNEPNPKRILNAKNNNAEVASVWTNFGFINDGWMTADDGQEVLRVMAGSTLEIKRNVWAQFLSNPNSSMTFEIDFKVDNVTNLSDPIVRMFEGTPASFKGVCMNALEGWVMNASNTAKDNCLFSWQEGVRTHISINLHHQVKPNRGDVYYTEADAGKANGTMALARVIMNGDCVREIPFSVTNANEWCSNSEGSIIIGNEGADIDIYSIRIYEGKVVEMTDILNRNYLASIPNAEDKVRLRERNDLLDGGRISLEKAKNKGLNCYVWHGTLPYNKNQAEQNGWVEIFRYDSDGNYLPEYSGKICEATKSLVGKGQGSTAKTYYDWNLQEDSSKVKATIQVPISKFHVEIHVGSPYTSEDGKQYVDIYGGNLGKNIPIETDDNAQAYEYVNGMVVVPDGWFDGDGMYRGLGYRVAEGTSLAQKRVMKINYASSMQSHLIGACNTYDLLHRKVVGDTPLQEVIPDAVSAKRTEPFMFFNQEAGSNSVYFKGMGTYGAGKADEVTWGFVKKQMPMYALIEGSDNNLPMTGFRVPFDKNTAVYDVEGEGWLYNGQQSFDFDLGNTDDNDVPTDAITQRWADIHNFIYLHSTNLKYFVGTFEEFKHSDKAQDTNYKYWCTDGTDAFRLKRYEYTSEEWVNAGLLYNDTYQPIDLKTSEETYSVYNEWIENGNGDYSLLNEAFIGAFVTHMKRFLKYFINEKSLQFNYCYVLGFLAGTDNSDKNTYYKIMPYAEEVEQDTEFTSWFAEKFHKSFDYSSVHQLYFDGDDMDSIFRTNNNSHQTKPYYIDRIHPYADGSTTSLYEGMGNQLFNFVEKAYEGTGELSAMMNQIMIAATELVQQTDKMYGLESGKVSLWGFLHKYFFNIQHYFPQIAYMEQARIRYEFPELLGFTSTGLGSRQIKPITQSLGSQLQNELQYMNQRVIYMTSYAAFSAWGGDTAHSIGLPDANETFSFVPASMPDGSASTYTFTITPHQYIYPSHFYGGTVTSTRQRTSPSQTCTFTIAKNVLGSDTGMGICGINYISDLGEFMGKSIDSKLTVNGKRLTKFAASWAHNNAFRPTSVEFSAPNLTSLLLDAINNSIPSVLNLSKLVRAKTFRVYGNYTEIISPKSSLLQSYNYGANSYCKSISIFIEHTPSLRSLTTESSTLVKQKNFHVGSNVGTNVEGFTVQPIVESIYSAQKSQSTPTLQSIHVENVNWTDFDVNALSWFADIPTCKFEGTIAIKEDGIGGVPRVTWDLKNKFNKKFGVVDNKADNDYKGLLLNYTIRAIDFSKLQMKGQFYVETPDKKFYVKLAPASIYENSQMGIYFYIKTQPKNSKISIVNNYSYATVTAHTLSNTYDTAEIGCTIWSKNSPSQTVTKTIEIWNRPAQVGDLVYADGTFSSAASWDEEKTPIGICFYVPPRDDNGNVLPKFANPNDKQLRLMVALEETRVSINGALTSSLQWGAQMPTSSESDAWNAQYTLYDTDNDGNRVNLTSSDTAKVPDVYDILTVRNLTSRGLDNVYIDPDPATNPSGASDYRDTSTADGLMNDGFKCVAPDMAIGDGFAYNEASMAFDSVGERTLNAELAELASGIYKEDDIVNSGYAKTLKVIQHRNNLLNNNIIGADGEVIYTGGTYPLPTASGSITEIKALGTLIDQLRTWAANKNGSDEPYPTKWQQLAYPFVSACYAYQPTQSLQDGEVLADKFKSHNWFAPTEGQLARICWYAKYGAKGGFDAFKDARERGILGNLSTASSDRWSVTEGGSHVAWHVNFTNGYTGGNYRSTSMVGRAVSAF